VSFVYCIALPGWVEPGIVKLGFSKHPENRLKQLTVGGPFALSIKFTAPGTRDTEAELHRIFSKFRAFGEWFDEPPQLGTVFHLLNTNRCADAFDARPAVDQLRSWMLKTGTNKTRLAAACGVCEATIAKTLKTGKTANLRHRLADVTDGVVSYEDWNKEPFGRGYGESTAERIAKFEERATANASWLVELNARRLAKAVPA
jgi:hypothetical protein